MRAKKAEFARAAEAAGWGILGRAWFGSSFYQVGIPLGETSQGPTTQGKWLYPEDGAELLLPRVFIHPGWETGPAISALIRLDNIHGIPGGARRLVRLMTDDLRLFLDFRRRGLPLDLFDPARHSSAVRRLVTEGAVLTAFSLEQALALHPGGGPEWVKNPIAVSPLE